MSPKKKSLPPTYFFAAIIISIILHFTLPVLRFMYFPENLTGIIFIVAGAIFNISADRAFKEVNTTVKPFEEPTCLMTEGVFRISRNPMYLGMLLILFGLSILLGSISPFIVVLIFGRLINRRFIQIEEKMLLEKFGDEWRHYKNKVRRWI